jgi:phage protein D
MSLLAPTNPLAGSQFRQPLLSVLLNGSVALPAYEAEITNASHFTSDTFRVECSLTAMPPNYGSPYWSDSVNDQVQISIGAGTGTPVPFILGQVDNAEIDQIRQILTLTGRDLSALFIDAKTTEKFQNQTSSQIAATLAARHNLQTNIAQTMTKVGTYYAVDQVNLTREESEWDLLIFLAQHEGYDLWVSGNTLNFQPALDLDTVAPYQMVYSTPSQGGIGQYANFTGLKLNRSQTLARDVIVIVRSWNQLQEKAFTVTYKRTQANKGQRAGGQAQTYSFTVPNLTQQAALNYAMQKAEQITRMERVITAEMADDDTLTIRTPIQLVGTGTSFDQKYYPDTITRKISFEQCRMSVRAKNHSTQSTTIL